MIFNNTIIIHILTITLFTIIICNLFDNNQPPGTYAVSNQYENMEGKQKLTKCTLYYASWCYYSKKYLPEWDNIIKYLENNNPNIIAEKILCENTKKEICDAHNISGYPTVIAEYSDTSGNSKEKIFVGGITTNELKKFLQNI